VQTDTTQSPEVTAWTKYADLTPDQRARYGDYVLAKELRGHELIAMAASQERARLAMLACGGDKMKAFAMLLKERA
jgi:hypothetical protein